MVVGEFHEAIFEELIRPATFSAQIAGSDLSAPSVSL
jgi:hypothetical protein